VLEVTAQSRRSVRHNNKARHSAGFVVSASEFCRAATAFALRASRSAPALGQQRIEHFHDQALLRLGQGLQAFELLLQLGRGE